LIPNKKARELGAEANFLIVQLIKERLQGSSAGAGFGDDLLGFMLSEMKMEGDMPYSYSSSKRIKNCLTIQDVVDECKTLLIAGQETTKLSLTWTMMLLALNPPWQDRVRDEVMVITGGAHHPDSNMLARMKTVIAIISLLLMNLLMNFIYGN
jgi:cytochrome P450